MEVKVKVDPAQMGVLVSSRVKDHYKRGDMLCMNLAGSVLGSSFLLSC